MLRRVVSRSSKEPAIAARTVSARRVRRLTAFWRGLPPEARTSLGESDGEDVLAKAALAATAPPKQGELTQNEEQGNKFQLKAQKKFRQRTTIRLQTIAHEREKEREERGVRRARGGYGRLVTNERGPRELAGIANERLGTRLVSLT